MSDNNIKSKRVKQLGLKDKALRRSWKKRSVLSSLKRVGCRLPAGNNFSSHLSKQGGAKVRQTLKGGGSGED